MTASAPLSALSDANLTRTDARRCDPAGRPAGRARMAAVGVLAFALLATAACGKKDAGDPQADPTIGTVLNESPGATPTADAAASGAPGASGQPNPSGSGGQAAPTYPATVKDYGLAMLAAWSAKNKSRIDLLAVQAAALQAGGMTPGPDSQWTYLSCTDKPDNKAECRYRNAHGDDATLMLVKSQLGRTAAVLDFHADKTAYPTEAGAYVSTFMLAWDAGNKPRMTRLSSSTVVNFFNGKTPPGSGSTSNPSPDGSNWIVKTTGLPVGDGSWTFKVTGSKLGGASAITAVS
jgi:hypothetical protein